MELLTDRNFLNYASENYQNPVCSSTTEFLEDLRRIKYIKKLITRYLETGELKERLILNHIIVLNNVFKPEVLCRILYLKMAPQFKYVKPFLVFISVLQDQIIHVKEEGVIRLDFIPMDQGIIDALRKIRDGVNVQKRLKNSKRIWEPQQIQWEHHRR